MSTNNSTKDPHTAASIQDKEYIIGIGFSAGGMDALNKFFDHTPHDSVSYIVINHLPSDFKSQMAGLLAKHSKLKIFEIENNMSVGRNCVYLMPERKNITLSDGKFIVSEASNLQPNSAIDIFLDSLAVDKGNKSIAVILSGTGTDGTKGIASIKKAGGMVIVQSPETAKYDGMPNSAIETGLANCILSPEQMPFEILNYVTQDSLLNTLRNENSDEDTRNLQQILDLVKDKTPLDFTNYKHTTILRRVIRRMVFNNIDSLSDYYKYLLDKPDEVEILSKEFLISVTRFFRDPEAFELIKAKIIPDIIQNKLSVDPVKVWVVGCATGEEAYSLAILVKEHLTSINKDFEVKIFATDIDKDAINLASKGIYPLSIDKDVSEERLNKFFTRSDDKYVIDDEIRKMIIFGHHDIIKQPPYGKIDLISCRNLLIYLNSILQKKVFSTLHFCLNLGGYLFLGPSESLGEFNKFFLNIDDNFKIYKNNEVAKSIGNQSFVHRDYIKQEFHPQPSLKPVKRIEKSNSADLIIQSLVKTSGYTGVYIDLEYKVTQPFGDLKRYFKPEMFNFNLLEIVPEELSIALGSTLHDAISLNKFTSLKEIQFLDNDLHRSVNILVIPLELDNLKTNSNILVLFNDHKAQDSAINQWEKFNLESHTNRYLKELEEEVKDTKRKLQQSQEFIEISKENAQAYNEELVSTNEEVQSTNEELQSVNEELQTVNNEYQGKIKELADSNDDLNNYFRSTLISQIYVDKDLIIRKFTPITVKQINLIEADIGRSLGNISSNIKFEGFIGDIVEVITDSVVKETEVQTKDERWYQMMIIPYIRQTLNKTDGAIITFNDITELKKAEQKLKETNAEVLKKKNDELIKINNDLDNFIYTASHDLKAPIANMEGLLRVIGRVNPLDEQDAKIIEMLFRSVSKLKKTINELTNISEVQKSFEEDFDNINLEMLLEEVKESIADIIQRSNSKIVADFHNAPMVRFSGKNIRSILYNLLSNAIKYRSQERDPEIFIQSSDKGDYILICFQDNGLGIRKENIGKLFTMFRRFHAHIEGTGIGLYIVKRIIDNAEGKIEVESEENKGTLFKIYLKK